MDAIDLVLLILGATGAAVIGSSSFISRQTLHKWAERRAARTPSKPSWALQFVDCTMCLGWWLAVADVILYAVFEVLALAPLLFVWRLVNIACAVSLVGFLASK